MTWRLVAVPLVATLVGVGGKLLAAPVRGVDVVPCSVAIDQFSRPQGHVPGLRLVFGRIWLPRRVVRLAPRPKVGWDRFAKVGLVIRAGSPIELEVPGAWRSTYSLEYAPGESRARKVRDGQTRLIVQACGGPLGKWSAYAGGYVVKKPLCIPLIVRANGHATEAHVAVGRRCV